MTTQLRLPGIGPLKQIKPVLKRRDPAFWVRRVRLLRDLEASPESVIREVELRRGLNIVWTSPNQHSGVNKLFQSGIPGHTAGKTTFCRMIRFALGDRSFATDSTRRRIREKFPDGWVVAEVIVGKGEWLVARPFGIGAHPFCIRGATATDIGVGLREDYQVFLDALSAPVIEGLSSKRFPTTDLPVRWEHMLPWLARDQECRFADVLDWRHTTSDADSPSLDEEERQFVVRSVLGLISDSEQVERIRNAQLNERKKEAVRLAPLLAHQATVDHARVEQFLGRKVPPPSTELFGSEARTELDSQKASVASRLEALATSDPRVERRAALDRAIADETIARRNLEESEARLRYEEGALTALSGNGATQSLLAALPPPTGFCGVPMTLARQRACPLATTQPIDLGARRSERSTAEVLEDQAVVVRNLSAVVEAARATLRLAVDETTRARASFIGAMTAIDDAKGALLEERARLAQVERLVADSQAAWRRSEAQTAAVTQLTKDIEASYSRQEQIRAEGHAALGRFSTTFDYVVRGILGDEVEARVESKGRGLALVVELAGERESTALDIVKLLAFDLASLTESVQGRGTFPRFLIHDGPREADLAPDIYERLFLYLRELERCFEGEPSFQYIVTTTTPPPEDLLREPWLRLALAGIPANERLLRCDL